MVRHAHDHAQHLDVDSAHALNFRLADSGAKAKMPVSSAPMMPTTTFRNMPCCALVRMIMLAIQPRMPPITIQMMKFICTLPEKERNS